MNNEQNNVNVQTSGNNINNVGANNSKDNKKSKAPIIVIIVVIVIIIGVLAFSMIYFSNNSKDKNNNLTKENNNVLTTNGDSKSNECNVKPINITGLSKAEESFNKLTGWTVSGWDYINDGNASSEDLSTYYKVSTALYNLGYFEDSVYDKVTEEGCTLSKKTIDKEINNLFLNPNYNASEFMGNDCLSLTFEYNQKSEFYNVRSAATGGCGDSGGYVQKIYDDEEKDDSLTFKTKVLMYSPDGISYIDLNNEFKTVTENIPDDVTYDNAIDKYEEYANIYEWIFVKNNDGNYVFDKVTRLK